MPPAVPSHYLHLMTEADDDGWTYEAIDNEFPLGDGTADVEATVQCPHCGEPNVIALDPGSGGTQEYVEDCQVCCQPWLMYVRYSSDGRAHVEVHSSDA